MSDENYPTINFKITSNIVQHSGTKNWKWEIRWHVEGPDDVIDRDSAWFVTKREAQENLLFRFMSVLDEMAKEMGQ